MKYSLKSVPGPAEVGVRHGDGGWPQSSTLKVGVVRKKFQLTNLTMPNNSYFMNYALKSVPGIADVGVPHGDGDGAPELNPDVWRGQEKSFK